MSGLNKYKLKKFFTVKKIVLLVLLIGAVIVNASIKPKANTMAHQYKKPAKPINIIAAIKSAPTTIPAAIKSAQKEFSNISALPAKGRKLIDNQIEQGKQNFKDANAALKKR